MGVSQALAQKTCSASFAWDPIWLEGRQTRLSISLDETGGPGDHVGTFYVKAGDSADSSNWQTETLAPVPTAENGVAVHHRLQLELTCRGFLVGYTRTGGTTGNVLGAVTLKQQ